MNGHMWFCTGEAWKMSLQIHTYKHADFHFIFLTSGCYFSSIIIINTISPPFIYTYLHNYILLILRLHVY